MILSGVTLLIDCHQVKLPVAAPLVLLDLLLQVHFFNNWNEVIWIKAKHF